MRGTTLAYDPMFYMMDIRASSETQKGMNWV
jgi:hypothetical protein